METVLGKLGVAHSRRIASVGVDIPTHVAEIEDFVEMLAAVSADSAGFELADQLLFVVDVHRPLVAEAGFAAFLDLACILVFLKPFDRRPVVFAIDESDPPISTSQDQPFGIAPLA